MKLMEIYHSITEGKQVGILYHYTKPESFEKIVDNNLILSDVSNRGTLSFTRLGYGLYGFGECRFVLDGTRMSHKYKIIPDSLARLPNSGGKFFKNGAPVYKSPISKQGEERIYGIKDIDLKPYLIAIQINNLDDYRDVDIIRLRTKLQNLTTVPLIVTKDGNWKPYK